MVGVVGTSSSEIVDAHSLEVRLATAGIAYTTSHCDDQEGRRIVLSLTDCSAEVILYGQAAGSGTIDERTSSKSVPVTVSAPLRTVTSDYLAIMANMVASKYGVEYVELPDLRQGYFCRSVHSSEDFLVALQAVRVADQLVRRIHQRELDRFVAIFNEELCRR